MTAAPEDAFVALCGSQRSAKPWSTRAPLAVTEELWRFLQETAATHTSRAICA